MTRLTKEQVARIAYGAYCEALQDSTGEKQVSFNDLQKNVRNAWRYAGSVAREIGERYYEEQVKEAIRGLQIENDIDKVEEE